jgi:hypothetical protein
MSVAALLVQQAVRLYVCCSATSAKKGLCNRLYVCMSFAALLVLKRGYATGCMFAFLVMAKLWALIKRGQ